MSQPRYRIEFAPSAIDHLRGLPARDRRIILDGTETRLSHEPTSPGRNRKLLRTNNLSTWELRLGNYRVYYDVESGKLQVTVRAIGRKVRDKVVIEGLERKLTE